MRPQTRCCVRILAFALCISIAHSLVLTCACGVAPESSLPGQANQDGYQRHFPIFLSDESDFSAYDIKGKGTKDEPYVLRDVNITSTLACLSISGISSFFVVEHCYLRLLPHAGFDYGGVISATLTENLIIRDCIIAGGTYGVVLYGVFDSVIELSTVRDCWTGFLCAGNNITLRSNRILENRLGVECYNTYNSMINHNRIYCNGVGIELMPSTSENVLWDNGFGWNGQNAVDYGDGNTWDDGSSLGNMWTDYYGFGDYHIGGWSSSVDRFPLTLTDADAAQVAGPDNLTIPSQTSGSILTWEAIDDYPLTCNVTVEKLGTDTLLDIPEQVCIVSPEWNHDTVHIALPPLPEGEYNVVAEFCDAAGNLALDSVLVGVQRSITTGGATAIVVSVVVFASGVFVLEMMRKRGKRETPAVSPEGVGHY